MGFSKLSDWIKLKGSTLPDFYGNNKGVQLASDLLGFNDRFELADYVFTTHFEEVYRLSIDAQRKCFTMLLDNTATRGEDYVDQAKKFLNANHKEFESMDDLNVEFNFRSTLMEIVTPAKDGTFRTVLIRIE